MTTTPQRRTRQRATIAEVLAELEEFRTAQDIHDLLRRRGDSVGLATVYRNLQAMAEAGEVDVVRTPDGQASYRACGEATHAHHHHLICRVCGRTLEVEFEGVEELIAALAAQHGFTDVDHSFELHGLCATCAAATDSPKET
ncbi:Fur family transcriptional regulator [Propioniciclava sinopodophylli]|uniref:Fur family transcriptional regulator n=1 Tax=Propioniciclava sinopodophylli TaxID=1837344 RepID=UPI00248FDC52|nr:transcriptional repressor [Propioniciclava sinopodophylli]